MSEQITPRRQTRRMLEPEITNLNREPLLIADADFHTKGDPVQEFRIHADGYVDGGGESDIYRATRMSDGQAFAAKIYRSVAVDDQTIRLREEICDLIMDHSDVNTWHLLPIAAHGVVMIPGTQGISYPKFVEIMPLLNEGNRLVRDGGALSVKAIRNIWLPQLVTAIRTLHSANWLHRDIKPDNLFQIDGMLALGDFGVCCKLLPDKRSIHETTHHAGTPGYVAPEVTTDYAIQASDCYSLGSTLATLCLGQHYSYHPSVNCGGKFGPALDILNQHLSQGKLPFSSGDDHFDQLLMGLLQFNPAHRYDLNVVEAYAQQSNWSPPPIQRTSTLTANFDGQAFSDKIALAKAMAQKWEQAKRYLYQGGVNNSPFLRDIGNAEGLGQFALDIIEKTARDDQDAGLTRLLRRLAPSLGICWRGTVFPDLTAIAGALASEAQEAITLLASGVLSSPGIIAGDHTRDTLVIFREAAEYIQKPFAAQAARWFGAFLLGHAPGALAQTPDEYFQTLTRGSGDPAERLLQCPEDARQLAWLRIQQGCDIWQLLENNNGDESDRLIRIYQFFEAHCQNPAIVREHYIRKGPHGHLTWLRDNLNLYEYKGQAAAAIRTSIQAKDLSNQESIANLEKCFLLLEGERIGFLKLFQGNLLLARLGYTCGKPIISSDVNAYFIGKRMGADVPLGFCRGLLESGG